VVDIAEVDDGDAGGDDKRHGEELPLGGSSGLRRLDFQLDGRLFLQWRGGGDLILLLIGG